MHAHIIETVSNKTRDAQILKKPSPRENGASVGALRKLDRHNLSIFSIPFLLKSTDIADSYLITQPGGKCAADSLQHEHNDKWTTGDRLASTPITRMAETTVSPYTSKKAKKKKKMIRRSGSCFAPADHVNEVKLDADATTAQMERNLLQYGKIQAALYTKHLRPSGKKQKSAVAMKTKAFRAFRVEPQFPLHVKNSWNHEAQSSEAEGGGLTSVAVTTALRAY